VKTKRGARGRRGRVEENAGITHRPDLLKGERRVRGLDGCPEGIVRKIGDDAEVSGDCSGKVDANETHGTMTSYDTHPLDVLSWTRDSDPAFSPNINAVAWMGALLVCTAYS
jgi:hypothetical protein